MMKKNLFFGVFWLMTQSVLWGQAPVNIPCDMLEYDPAFMEADTLPMQIDSVPVTLEDGLLALDTILNPYQKRYLMCIPPAEVRQTLQYGLGLWLQDYWGLWGAAPLRIHLLKRGILHPEDMASVILVSYYRKLRGEPIQLQQQIDYYQNYWRAQGVNVDSLLQRSIGNN